MCNKDRSSHNRDSHYTNSTYGCRPFIALTTQSTASRTKRKQWPNEQHKRKPYAVNKWKINKTGKCLAQPGPCSDLNAWAKTSSRE